MNLISIDGASKTLNEFPLFENVTLGIDSTDRIGLVGRNGTGKSTFLKMITGELEPDSGNIARNRQLSLSALEQSHLFDPDESLRDFLFRSDDPLIALVGEYERCLGEAHGSPAMERRLSVLGHEMETRNGFGVEQKFTSILSELGLPDPDTRMGTLSGGMVKKAALARSIAPGSSLLLLDEPTNHLDIETIEWLEKVLKNANFAFILVTHDRYFLDAVCNTILEIDKGDIYRYSGNYSAFLEKRAERYALLERIEAKREAVLRVELEWLRRGPKARAGKSKSRTARILDLVDGRAQKEVSMDEFSTTDRRLGKKILEIKSVAKSYGDKEVLKPFSYGFKRGERIGIIGPNGSGKTTLLDMISGRTEATGGIVEKGDNTVFAYFDQTAATVNRDSTVLEFVKDHAERIDMQDGTTLSAEQLLERFLFPRAMFSQTLSRLSGGEIRRLQLIRLLATGPNFLLLDEPTNDLDIDTISLLEEFLVDFGGCVLAVSHDRSFLDRVTDYLFIFDGNGGIRGFGGGYTDYRDAFPGGSPAASRPDQKTASAQAEAGNARQGQDTSQAEEPAPEKKKKLSFAEKKEYEGLLTSIDALETEKRELETLFSRESVDGESLQKASRRYDEVGKLLASGLARWEELAERS